MTWVNDDDVERRTTRLKDGPLDGQPTLRPDRRLRQEKHAQAFRLPDEQQPWHPGMPGPERVKFAVYLWLPSDQHYCWVDFVTVGSKRELDMALDVVQRG